MQNIRFVVPALMLLGGCGIFFRKPEPRYAGEACVETNECAQGLICARDAVCRIPGEPGTLEVGDPCLTTAQCGIGLACAAEGTCQTEGSPGTIGSGETCDENAAEPPCRFGLTCVAGVCAGFEAPFWPGGDCPDPELEDGPFRVLFEVPDGEPLADFYRLPFPNDIRRNGAGVIDLSGHPSPGPLIELLGDVVGNVIRAVEVEANAFGPNQTAFFRFSASPDLGTLAIGLPSNGGNVAVIDITPGADTLGEQPAFRFEASTARGAYICHNWLAIQPLDGVPYRPGHTYAVVVGRTIAAKEDGATAAPDADFTALLAAEPPGDARLSDAWVDYAPLRSWITAAGVDPGTLAGAAVFTVQDPPGDVADLRAAVETEPAPTASGLVLCGDGADPFADASDPTRGCQAPAGAGFYELQATVGLPQYQSGTPPFKDLTDGGTIDLRNLTVHRTEQVHVTLTIPTGPAPVDGWPVVLYGHGTGGNYTSLVREGLAEALSSITLADGTTVQAAMIGFDAPLHGPRAAPENHKAAWLAVDPNAYSADTLFFNPINPRAARDNALQEAVDLWSLVQFAAAFSLGAEVSPTGEAIRFSDSQRYYLGHSQGGVVGATFLAHEPGIAAAVLSGAGGLTIQSLLNKTSPSDVAAAVRVGLADPDVSRTHPLLNLAQALADRSDGINHARHLVRDPLDGHDPIHVLQIFGVGDTYSPTETQFPLARALGLQQSPNGNPPLERLTTVSLPVSANFAGITAVVSLYANAGDDAHFVLFDRPDALHHTATFFGTAIRDGVPTVEPLP